MPNLFSFKFVWKTSAKGQNGENFVREINLLPRNKKILQLMIFLAFTKLETVTSFQRKDKIEPTPVEHKQFLFERVENFFIT